MKSDCIGKAAEDGHLNIGNSRNRHLSGNFLGRVVGTDFEDVIRNSEVNPLV